MRWDFIKDPIAIKIIVRKYYEKLYTHKINNLDENEHLFKSDKLSKLTQEEERILDSVYESQHYSETENKKE